MKCSSHITTKCSIKTLLPKTQDVVIGSLGAEWIAARLGGKGNVVVLEGIPGAASSEDRKKGAAEVFPKYSGIKIVSQQTAEYDRAKALHVMDIKNLRFLAKTEGQI